MRDRDSAEHYGTEDCADDRGLFMAIEGSAHMEELFAQSLQLRQERERVRVERDGGRSALPPNVNVSGLARESRCGQHGKELTECAFPYIPRNSRRGPEPGRSEEHTSELQ